MKTLFKHAQQQCTAQQGLVHSVLGFVLTIGAAGRMQPPCIIHRLYREDCGALRDERDLGEDHVVSTQRRDGCYVCSDKCPMLAVLGPASGGLWHPLLPRLALMNMDMVQHVMESAHREPSDWFQLWLEEMDSVILRTPLQLIATKLFSNQTLGETWIEAVDACYEQAYTSPDAWTGRTASLTKMQFVRSSLMSAAAIYERMRNARAMPQFPAH
jgi:hypothetical protein